LLALVAEVVFTPEDLAKECEALSCHGWEDLDTNLSWEQNYRSLIFIILPVTVLSFTFICYII
jgi:hypothetical protein